MALFESYERRINQINEALNKYGISSLEDAKKICDDKGIDVYNLVKGVQPICFENACWAYITGAAIAIKKGCTKAADAAEAIGEGLQSFCIPGSVADDRKVGLGHGNLAAMLLREDTKCFAFLAGHESFAAAEGAIGIAKSANKVRKEPLKVILNGLGKDAAQIISRINGFTFVETKFDYMTGKLNIVSKTAYSDGEKARFSATVRTMCVRALQSCTTKMLTFPSQVTQPTPHVSSIPLWAHIKRNASKKAKSISRLLPAAAPAEHFIPITWLQVRLPMV